MRYIILCSLVAYTSICNTARAQIFDASSETSNQVDTELIRTITSASANDGPDQSQSPAPEQTSNPKPKRTSSQAKADLYSISPFKPVIITSTPIAKWTGNPYNQHVESANNGLGYQPKTPPSSNTEPKAPPTGEIATRSANNGNDKWRPGIFSGFRPPDTKNSEIDTRLVRLISVITQQTFNAKNSFVPGMGDTQTFQNQIGLDFTTPYATDIQPYLTYQYADRKLGEVESFRDNSFGGALTVSQKIFPFAPVFNGPPEDSQPGAVYNLRGPHEDEAALLAQGKDVPNMYPNFDTKVALAFVYGDNNQETYTKHKNWAYLTQDVYSLSPSLNFDFYLKRLYNAPRDQRWLPNSITIIPGYLNQFTSSDDGTSGSSGIFSVQEKNLWVVPLQPPPPPREGTDPNSGRAVDANPSEYLSIVESNSILHDTNEEPLQPPNSPPLYQNWVKFSLALQYTKDKAMSAKVEYTYEGLNALYEANNVVVSVTINLP